MDDFKGFKEGSECDEITQEFFKDQDIKILQDHVIRKSFYIRDRDCIQTIRGTPDELLQILSEDKFLWKPLCGWHQSKDALELLTLRALAETKAPVSAEMSQQIKSNFAGSGNEACVDTFIRCEKAGRLEEYREYMQSMAKPGTYFSCGDASKLCLKPAYSELDP